MYNKSTYFKSTYFKSSYFGISILEEIWQDTKELTVGLLRFLGFNLNIETKEEHMLELTKDEE